MSTVALSIRTVPCRPTDAAWALLDPIEQARAERRSLPGPFVTAHALLRQLVGEVLSLPPDEIEFERSCVGCGSSAHGKPFVVGRPDVHVSVSYGERLAVAAVSHGAAIGVDVESHEAADFEGFDRVTLAAEEAVSLAGRTGEQLLGARCRIWARKEAILKATGHGLTIDPTCVVVSPPDRPAAVVAWRAAGIPAPTVTVLDVVPGRRGHEIALARCSADPLELALVD